MEPQLGWAWLSQRERRTAEQALSDLGPDGTRDELGFGVVHFAYADRFFPGTSVQHTQLRYVWFTCWSYLDLRRRSGPGPFPAVELVRMEDQTGHRLLRAYGNGDGHGIIGGRVLRITGRSPVVKPSAVYWSAMRAWGIVSPLTPGRDPPGRAEVHARWEELSPGASRPEVDAGRPCPLFVDPPPIPSGWRAATGPLEFDLDSAHDEAGRIRRAWARQRDARGRPTLLSRLAERGGPAPESIVARRVLGLCFGDEVISLRRAGQAGSLAAVARAVHTHLVQLMKDPDSDDALATRAWLDQAVAGHAGGASALEVPGLLADVPEAAKLVPLVEATQSWLEDGAGETAALERVFREREEAQKPGRALLARSGGDRRAGWWPRPSGPLAYRWDRVAGFLDQLAGR